MIHKVLLADGWGRGKCKPRKEVMKIVRESQIDGYEVVTLQPGDTIPTDAIEVDGEWHFPKAAPAEEPAPEPKKEGK